jgi:hypothetical protein
MSSVSTSISSAGITTAYLILTTIFFGFKMFKTHNPPTIDNAGGLSSAWSIGFIILILVIEFFYNLSVAAKVCNGSPQNAVSVLLYTLLPNFLILGSVIMLISVFPGWLSPFSNTLGYFLISCMGLSRNFNSLLKSPKNSGSAGALLTKICSDKSLVINEMTPDNYSDFMKTLSNIFVKGFQSKPEYKNLYSLVVIKTLISEYIWYLLAGMLAISVGSHAISTIQCDYSPEQMKKTISQLHKEEQEMEVEKQYKQPVLYTKNN